MTPAPVDGSLGLKLPNGYVQLTLTHVYPVDVPAVETWLKSQIEWLRIQTVATAIVGTAEEATYITVNPGTRDHTFNTVIMEYNYRDDAYQVKKISDPLTEIAARALADSWKAATGYEIR